MIGDFPPSVREEIDFKLDESQDRFGIRRVSGDGWRACSIFQRLFDDPATRPQVRALGMGMFTPFDERTEVLPGLVAFHVSGHTRDSVAVELVRGERRFLFPADNCHLLESCRGRRAGGSVEDAAANRAFVERFADYPGEILSHHDPQLHGGPQGAAVVRVHPGNGQG